MNFKRLVLGTAAGALAVTGAQAADLPVVVEPVDYVQICSAYGDGYFFVPGTEGCLRIRGRVRTDFELRFDLEDNGFVLPGFGFDDFTDTGYRWRARAEMSFDHITETEFGQLRAFANFRMQRTSGVGVDAGPTNDFELVNGFIQLGGFLAGRTASNFKSVTGGPEVILDVAGENPDILQIAYTASFGNGFSATLALEDTTRRRNFDGASGTGIGNELSNPAGFFSVVPGVIPGFGGVYGGAKLPDLVASIGVSQGWGSANLSGALRYLEVAQIFTVTNPLSPGFGNSVLFDQEEDLGWAISGNVTVNVPFGTATSISLGAGYSQGATDYITSGVLPEGFGFQTDGGYTYNPAALLVLGPTASSFEKNDAWAIGGNIKTAFTPTVAAQLAAGWVHVDHYIPGAEVDNINVQGQIAWTPVTDFTIAAGVEYTYADVSIPNQFPGLGSTSIDGSGLGTYIRLQRDF